jgi:hypothetical protein
MLCLIGGILMIVVNAKAKSDNNDIIKLKKNNK